MIDYKRYLLGREVQVCTKNWKAHTGLYEGIQLLGPDGGPFVVIKLDDNRTMFIPENLVERIYLVEESSIPGEDGEGSGGNN